MSILERRRSAAVYVAGLVSGFALAALFGMRPWETHATAQSKAPAQLQGQAPAQGDSTLAAKVAALQTNVSNLRNRIDNSKERIVAVEEILEDVLLGDVPAGNAKNADTLDELDSTAFQLVLSAGEGIEIEDQEIRVDFSAFDEKYLSKKGGTVGPLTVEGDLTVDGMLILGSFSGYPEAPKAGTVIFNTESRRAELFDGSNWRPL